MTGHAGPLVE